MISILTTGLVMLSTLSMAQITPTAPGPGETFAAGTVCPILWQPDTTGTWKIFKIDLMSGSNNNMSFVTNVASGLDETSSSYNWTCPEVNPYSAIYFYQFSQQGQSTSSSPAWTTRFTIASPNGTITPPEYPTQPNGDAIPWGTGQLASTDAQAAISATSATNMAQPAPLPSKTQAKSEAHAPPPEVTMNVPAPNTRRVRRAGFMTIYTGQPYVTDLPNRRAIN